MEYKKVKINTYNLHMIKTERFKTINIQITFSNNVVKKDITKVNFLADILSYSNKTYPTKKQLSMALQNLYAANINTSCYRLGRYYNTDINFYLLNEKYTEAGMFEKSISLLADIINNPNITDGKFDSSSFDVVYENINSQIESIKENPRKYGILKMLEAMNSNAPYSFHSYGYKEDLDAINTSNLAEYYKEFINNSYVDVFIIGNIDFDKTKELFEKNFQLISRTDERTSALCEAEDLRTEVQEVVEVENLGQSKLSIGCKIQPLTDYERNYCLTLYNIILGGGGDSLLFRNVREKNSLCYYIFSSANKLDNLLLICSGINKDAYAKTLQLIKEEMENIKNGKFTEEDLEKAKMQYVAAMEEIYDSPNQIISAYYATALLGIDPPEERKQKIKEVTYQDIMKVAEKIEIDTIHLLKGAD